MRSQPLAIFCNLAVVTTVLFFAGNLYSRGGHGGHSGHSGHGTGNRGGQNRPGNSRPAGHRESGRSVGTHHQQGQYRPHFERGGTRYTQRPTQHHERRVMERSHHAFQGGALKPQHRYYDRTYWGGRRYLSYHRHWSYGPNFWRWYATPYPAPVTYVWHWRWAPYWGYYYAPYPTYIAADYWLTDYVVSRTLTDAYRDENTAPAANATGVGDEEKNQLRNEIREAAALHEAEQPLELKNALGKPGYLFLVDTPYQVLPEGSETGCVISGGDLLRVHRKPEDDETYAVMQVVTAKDGNCAAGTRVNVPLDELQEMLNSFAAKADDGLHELDEQTTSQPKEDQRKGEP